MENDLTIRDYAAAFRRRIWILTVAIAIGSPLSLGVAYLLPPVYRSTATILVESQQIPSDLARSTVTAGVGERLQQIEQRLMTRENLLRVMEQFNVYAHRRDLTLTEKIEMMRESTQIENIAIDSSRRRGEMANVTAFTISFEADRADVAAKVTNEFVSIVIDQNVRGRNERASETNSFFQKEVVRLAGELLTLEAEITEYKRENADSLPESLEFRRTELAGLDARMFDRERRLIELEETKRGLERASITGEGAAITERLSEEEKQLKALEANYMQQKAVYAESHPSMRTMAARIERLRQSINPSAGGDTSVSLREELIRQQIDVIGSQLAHLAEQRAADEARKAALETSIANTPQVEMVLNELRRRHSHLQTQYQQTVLKQGEAETGEKLEINRQAERFEIIEQALVPEEPEAPNRPLIAFGGIFSSLALGLGLMTLAEMLNNVIRTPRDLERALKLHPVVTIPYVSTAAETRMRRLRIVGSAVALLVIVPSGLYAVDQYYLPLPLLAEGLLQEMGLDWVLVLISQRF
jgi:polysaccharide chain length determinant protein (PEP-CTERM system associated)